MNHYDIFIIGAGLTGASLALALSGHGLRVGVAEAVPLKDPGQPSYDDKALALSYASMRILQTLGIWQTLAATAAPIRQVHVSQRGHFGITRIHARELGVAALGQVVPARTLGSVLLRELQAAGDVDLFCPASLHSLEREAYKTRLTLQRDSRIEVFQTGLVVGADGARSALRELLGIGVDAVDYRQRALVTNVTPSEAHAGCAYERFTAQGPIALLPLQGQRMGLVWTGTPDAIAALLGLDDAAFLHRLQQAFGGRLGRFTRAGARTSYPLRAGYARSLTRPGAVLIGNAAQALHPVAAQGFNLGLRDVAILAETLLAARRAGKPWGAWEVLKGYGHRRATDHRRTRWFTHGVAQSFLGDVAPQACVRGLGLFGLDLLPPLKRAFTRRAMGLAGSTPLLVRGVPLTG